MLARIVAMRIQNGGTWSWRCGGQWRWRTRTWRRWRRRLLRGGRYLGIVTLFVRLVLQIGRRSSDEILELVGRQDREIPVEMYQVETRRTGVSRISSKDWPLTYAAQEACLCWWRSVDECRLSGQRSVSWCTWFWAVREILLSPGDRYQRRSGPPSSGRLPHPVPTAPGRRPAPPLPTTENRRRRIASWSERQFVEI